jgi:hypothetical protein
MDRKCDFQVHQRTKLLLVRLLCLACLLWPVDGVDVVLSDGFAFSGLGRSVTPLPKQVSVQQMGMPLPAAFSAPSATYFHGGVYCSKYNSVLLVPRGAAEGFVLVSLDGANVTLLNAWPEGKKPVSSTDFFVMGAVYDGKDEVWHGPGTAPFAFVLNVASGRMRTIAFPESEVPFVRYAFTRLAPDLNFDNLWLPPHNVSGRRIGRIHVKQETFTTVIGRFPSECAVDGGSAFNLALTQRGKVQLWFIPRTASHIVSFDPTTQNMTAYSNYPPSTISMSTAKKFDGGTSDGRFLWLLSSRLTVLIKFDTASGLMRTVSIPSNGRYARAVFDGTSLWALPFPGTKLLRVHTVSHASEVVDLATSIPGLDPAFSTYQSLVFDGTSVWLVPLQQAPVVRIVAGLPVPPRFHGEPPLRRAVHPTHGNVTFRPLIGDTTTSITEQLNVTVFPITLFPSASLPTDPNARKVAVAVTDAARDRVLLLPEQATAIVTILTRLYAPWSDEDDSDVRFGARIDPLPPGVTASGELASRGAVIVDDKLFLWMAAVTRPIVLDLLTDVARIAKAEWPSGTPSSFNADLGTALHAAGYIWMPPCRSRSVARIDPSTEVTTVYNNVLPSTVTYQSCQGFISAAATEEGDLWFAPWCAEAVVSLPRGRNPGSPSSYRVFTQLPNVTSSTKYLAIVTTGSFLILAPYSTSMPILRVDTRNGFITTIPRPAIATASFSAAVYDSSLVWMVPANGGPLLVVDPSSGAWSQLTLDPGTPYPTADAFQSAAFDGESLWIPPRVAHSLVRIRPRRLAISNGVTSSGGKRMRPAPISPCEAIAVGNAELFPPIFGSMSTNTLLQGVFDGNRTVYFCPSRSPTAVAVDIYTRQMRELRFYQSAETIVLSDSFALVGSMLISVQRSGTIRTLNVLTGEIDTTSYKLPKSTNGAFYASVYVPKRQELWVVPYTASYLLVINITSKETRAVDLQLANGESFAGGVLDQSERYIWLVPHDVTRTVKVDTETGGMVSYTLPIRSQYAQLYMGGVVAEDGYIYFGPCRARDFLRVDSTSGSMTYISIDAPSTSLFGGVVYDGRNLWAIPQTGTQAVAYTPATSSQTVVTFPPGSSTASSAYYMGVFDGRGIWIFPYLSQHVMRIVRRGDATLDEEHATNARMPAGFVSNQDGVSRSVPVPEIPRRPTETAWDYSSAFNYSTQTICVNGSLGTSEAFCGGVFDGDRVWALGDRARLNFRVNLKANATTDTVTTASPPTRWFCGGAVIPHDRIVGTSMMTRRAYQWNLTNTSANAWDMTVAWPSDIPISSPYQYHGATYDGRFVWHCPLSTTANSVPLRFDSRRNEEQTAAYYPAVNQPHAFLGVVFHASTVWFVPHVMLALTGVDLATHIVTQFSDWPSAWNIDSYDFKFGGGTTDGEHLWLFPYSARHVVKFHPDTHDVEGFDSYPPEIPPSQLNGVKFFGGAYDGRFLWMAFISGTFVIRFDTLTYRMVAIPIPFELRAVAPNATQRFAGVLVAGGSIWLTPRSGLCFVRLTPIQSNATDLHSSTTTTTLSRSTSGLSKSTTPAPSQTISDRFSRSTSLGPTYTRTLRDRPLSPSATAILSRAVTPSLRKSIERPGTSTLSTQAPLDEAVPAVREISRAENLALPPSVAGPAITVAATLGALVAPSTATKPTAARRISRAASACAGLLGQDPAADPVDAARADGFPSPYYFVPWVPIGGPRGDPMADATGAVISSAAATVVFMAIAVVAVPVYHGSAAHRWPSAGVAATAAGVTAFGGSFLLPSVAEAIGFVAFVDGSSGSQIGFSVVAGIVCAVCGVGPFVASVLLWRAQRVVERDREPRLKRDAALLVGLVLGPLVEGTRDAASAVQRAAATIDVVVAVTLGVLSGLLRGAPERVCVWVPYAMAAVSVGLVGYVAVVRPMESRLDLAVAVVLAGMQAALAVLTSISVATSAVPDSKMIGAVQAVGSAFEIACLCAPVLLALVTVTDYCKRRSGDDQRPKPVEATETTEAPLLREIPTAVENKSQHNDQSFPSHDICGAPRPMLNPLDRRV